jgi:hypothetical protein
VPPHLTGIGPPDREPPPAPGPDSEPGSGHPRQPPWWRAALRVRRFWLTRRFSLPAGLTVRWPDRLATPARPVTSARPVTAARPVTRWRRRAIPAAVAAVAVGITAAAGALLIISPLAAAASGPLSLPAGAGARFTWADRTTQPVAMVLPLINVGRSFAVIDAVSVQSGLGDAPARVLAVRAGRFDRFPCQAIGPARGSLVTSGPAAGQPVPSALAGCVRPALRPAAGLTVPGGTDAMGLDGWPIGNPARAGRPGLALVLTLARPAPSTCWSVLAVVIRYHIGASRYTSTSALADASVCAPPG